MDSINEFSKIVNHFARFFTNGAFLLQGAFEQASQAEALRQSEQLKSSLRVFVGSLRKKIEPIPAKPQYILTEPWVGYRFNVSGKQ